MVAIHGLEKEPKRSNCCLKCFNLHLTETARYAASYDLSVFATILASSLWKNLEQIKQVLSDISLINT
ncbi:epoxyqueuosine reductase QueH [Bacteroides stercoris]|uniref:epoxyqueuosine reductase QueH n=1 Tax=Bacteroides stercoris TaxID=46506 RepID=UPI000E4B0C05|nr:epoxyqueuosine reductase QueH [Bacteroides stercoris]RGZ94763.1 hypothetical protein DW966_02105 [Bacteroides stercoris]